MYNDKQFAETIKQFDEVPDDKVIGVLSRRHRTDQSTVKHLIERDIESRPEPEEPEDDYEDID